MKVSGKTIEALAQIISGDNGKAPYRSGPKLVNFFNQLSDSFDNYRQGFPTRIIYTRDKLSEICKLDRLNETIKILLDPREYLDTDYRVDSIVEYLNQYFRYDGLLIEKSGEFYKLSSTTGTIIPVDDDKLNTIELSSTFVNEQVLKCRKKLDDGDYDGAITNARSLLEGILLEIEFNISGAKGESDDLPKLYKRVQKLLNLDPKENGFSDAIKQILVGFVSVVHGLSTLRNQMSDAHATGMRPDKHHAELAVNSAKTMLSFIVDSYCYQKDRGIIK